MQGRSDGAGPTTDADVIVVGAGPTGLMLAAELRLAGARAVVLERRPDVDETPRANGLGGQILRLLRYRGLLERLEAASPGPAHPAPIFPFGDVHVDFSQLPEPPMWGLSLPQPELERLLGDHAVELGADVRRGHEVVGVGQDDGAVIADVDGPDGRYRASARYLVGCDGPRSTVREATGIAFPGTTYPEINRLGQVRLPDAVTRLDDGGLDVPGLGRIAPGFTHTERGVFAFGPLTPEVMLVFTKEDEPADTDEDAPMARAELEASIRRVLGGDLPVGEATRLSRWRFQARQAERYRDGRILLAGDAAHQFPATGIGISVGMLDAVNVAWKLAAELRGSTPEGLLDTYHDERHAAGARALMQTQAQVALRRGRDDAAVALRALFAELLADEQPLLRMGALLAGSDIRHPLPGPGDHALTGTFAPDLHTHEAHTTVAEPMRTARPVLLDLAGRDDLREAARPWQPRIEVVTAETDERPADAILIRPDAHVAWAATTGEPPDTEVPALREALLRWFGEPS